MAIAIGKPVSAVSLESAGKSFVVAGVVALGYGAMTTLGLTAEMASKLEMAKLIYELASPVVDASAAAFSHIAHGVGGPALQGELMTGAPTGVKVGLSGLVMGGLGTGFAVIGSKLREAGQNMADRTRLNPLDRLKSLKSDLRAGAFLNHESHDQEETPEAPRM